jgi:hypothetical protein
VATPDVPDAEVDVAPVVFAVALVVIPEAVEGLPVVEPAAVDAAPVEPALEVVPIVA